MTPKTQAPALAIISPTRNEAANVEEFTKRVVAALEGLEIDWEIVFADDSDDATPETVDQMVRWGHPVRVVHRRPDERVDSISGAVRAALATVDGDIAVVIDADLQHPPEVIPALVAPLFHGAADFAIGTRYSDHGSAEGLGSAWRRQASRASAVFTKVLFPQYWRCSDLASGLFAFRVADFRSGRGRSTGFKLLPEALVRCDPAQVVETGYVFEDRFDGLSKARLRDGVALAHALLRLRLVTRRVRPVPLLGDFTDLGLPRRDSDGTALHD